MSVVRDLDIMHFRPLVRPFNILEPDNPVPPAKDYRNLVPFPRVDRRVDVQAEVTKLLFAGGQVLRSAIPLEPAQKNCPATIQILSHHSLPPNAGLSVPLGYKSIDWRSTNVVLHNLQTDQGPSHLLRFASHYMSSKAKGPKAPRAVLPSHPRTKV